MSWQAFSWSELQARTPKLPERLLPAISVNNSTRVLEAIGLVGTFLTPFAVMEAALGLWRLGADLGWTGRFLSNPASCPAGRSGLHSPRLLKLRRCFSAKALAHPGRSRRTAGIVCYSDGKNGLRLDGFIHKRLFRRILP
jgi:hypothetical protein